MGQVELGGPLQIPIGHPHSGGWEGIPFQSCYHGRFERGGGEAVHGKTCWGKVVGMR